MASEPSHPWQTQEITELCEAIASLRSPDEAGRFLRDLCTLSELEAMAHRWQVARLDDDGDARGALAAVRRGRLPAGARPQEAPQSDRLTIAVPAKGRLREPAISLLDDAG